MNEALQADSFPYRTRHSLAEAGEVGRHLAALDWRSSPLDPPEQWPAPLLHCTLTLLRSPVPCMLLFGPRSYMLYNDACAALLGNHHPAALGASTFDVWPELSDFLQPVLEQVMSGRPLSLRDQELVVDINGHPEKFWLNLDYSPVMDEDGVPIAAVALIADTTAKVLAERRLATERDALQREFESTTAQLHLHARCLESASDGIVILDPAQPRNPLIFCNQGFERLTGYRRDEVLGRSCGFLQGPETDPDTAEQLQIALSERKPCNLTMKNYRKDGSTFWNRLSVTPLFDEAGELTHIIGILTDMTEAMELSQELSWQASHDPLTGLMNRREFERRLDRALSQSRVDRIGHVVCYLDLDNFKVINDTSGHLAGDRMLQAVSNILRKQLRGSDAIARLGGDEFGILLDSCTVEQALVIASRVIAAIGEYRFIWQEKLFRTGASVGLCVLDAETPSSMEMLRHADSACYTAKEAGGGRLHLYAPHDQDIQRRANEMESFSLVTRGLDEGLFYLNCQPILPLADGDKGGDHIEILLRMRSPTEGREILPGSFLPSAERYGFSPQLDRWVIDTTLRLLAEHPHYLERLGLCSINLSGISVSQENFGPYIRRKLQEYGIPPGRICFEITETAAISNLHGASRFMRNLKEVGCRFALDDFGSGLSSYAYLNALPVDFVKIDGLFVQDMHQDPVHQAMVKSIHEIASLMGKRTIAEYVEHEHIVERLQAIGVDYIQGFAIGAPVSFEQRLKSRRL